MILSNFEKYVFVLSNFEKCVFVLFKGMDLS
jgi:hypothetical protein